jgi:hypothetical protein
MQEEEISDGDTETVIYDISEFIYMLAIADSKKEVDKAIRKRRSDILETRATAAALKAKQADVDARADSTLPADIAVTLGNKFNALSAHIKGVQNALEAKIDLTIATPPSKKVCENELLSLTQRLSSLEEQCKQRSTPLEDIPLPPIKSALDKKIARLARAMKAATTAKANESPSSFLIDQSSSD